MSFTHAAFAVAGLVAAAGPVVVHLLNRRRYRTVEWGAMAFLRKAVQKSRRAVRLRDLLLLALRTAALLLFGFALARPTMTAAAAGEAAMLLLIAGGVKTLLGGIGLAVSRSTVWKTAWGALAAIGIATFVGAFVGPGGARASSASATASSREPIHVILVIDNSRSMGARSLGGTSLDIAKRRAAGALDQLPPGSRVAVLPLCGSERSYTLDTYRNLDDGRAAIERIAVTDRSGSALRAFSLAADAAKRAPDLPVKQVVFLSDRQATGWPKEGVAEAAKSVGGSIHVVLVGDDEGRSGAGDVANVWVESLVVQDGLAEVGSPATLLARVRHAGDAPVEGVEASVTIDGDVVASQTFDLRPGQSRELSMTVPIEASAEPGRAAFLPTTLTARASPSANRLDRDDARSLALPLVTSLPVVFVDQHGEDEDLDAGRVGETYRLRRLLAPRPAEGVYEPFVSIRHVSIDDLDEETLRDARLVVVAGIERPTGESVELLRTYVEHGGPLLLAAGANFDPAAWTADAWLDGQGILPAPLNETPIGIRPSQATATSRIEPFRLDSSSLRPPYFEIEGEPAEAVAELWRQPFFFQAVAADVSEQTIERIAAADESKEVPGQDAGDSALQVLARFDRLGPAGNHLPYLLERRIGDGRVVFLTAGLSSDWDTLAQTNAIVLLDRVVRSLLEGTLPRRAFETSDAITLPVERRADIEYSLISPGREARPVAVEATGAGYAVRIDDVSTAGIYTVEARRESGNGEAIERIVLAANGPAAESDLTPLSSDRLAKLAEEANLRWIDADEAIVLTGGAAGRDRAWKWLAGAVLACLFGEMVVAARHTARPAEAAR